VIEGVVIWLDTRRLDEALRALDALEDEGVDYRRVVIDSDTAEGTVAVFAYEYLKPLHGCPRVGPSWTHPPA
jgi:gamma-glutamylcyclotransferase (GGCT)/AIG2-like uncharacterized protein YtfP